MVISFLVAVWSIARAHAMALDAPGGSGALDDI
jgi:hypothetical protein